MSLGTIHLAKEKGKWATACGTSPMLFNVSDRLDRVTCGLCKRTTLYRAQVVEQELNRQPTTEPVWRSG